MISINRAQWYKDKQSDCWIYIWILLELGPEFHYKKKYIMPGGFIPGPNNPKFMESFLFPEFYHIVALQHEGLHIWNSLDDGMFNLDHFFILGAHLGSASIQLYF